MSDFAVVEVDGWEVLDVEPMGSKPDKLWLESPIDQSRWLFKPVTVQHEQHREYLKGDDWAELIASEVARRLEIPAAFVELATRAGDPGILSGDVSRDCQLVLGNEVLYGQDPDYDLHRRHGVPGYTVDAVFDALRTLETLPPPAATHLDAGAAFAGYLLLDALVANTDRHHENWGILTDPQAKHPPTLAPTFDHASCLGFQLSDDERVERLSTNDSNRTLEAFAARGQSRHFHDRPALVGLAMNALDLCTPQTRQAYRSGLESLSPEDIESIIGAIPEARMSQAARIFSGRLMTENRRRLLDEFDRAQ